MRISCPLCVLFLISTLEPTPLLAQRPPASVRVDRVREEQVEERRLVTGELRPVRRARVAAEEPGRVLNMPVLEGQSVEKGDLLVRLHARRLEIELAMNEAESRLARASQAEREADYTRLAKDLAALQKLDASGDANPKEMSDALAAERAAMARLDQAKAQVELILTRRQLLDQRLADTEIRAPFSGTVVRRERELGEWVARGDAVVELVTADRLEAWLSVPERFLRSLTRGKFEVTVGVPATGAEIVTSALRLIPNVDSQARAFGLIVPLSSADPSQTRGLAPGMAATAWIPVGREGPQLTIAKDAILRGETGPYVYAVRTLAPDEPPKVLPVQIKISFSFGSRVAIAAGGLQPGDEVVVEGNERLYPMAAVAPVREKKGPR